MLKSWCFFKRQNNHKCVYIYVIKKQLMKPTSSTFEAYLSCLAWKLNVAQNACWICSVTWHCSNSLLLWQNITEAEAHCHEVFRFVLSVTPYPPYPTLPSSTLPNVCTQRNTHTSGWVRGFTAIKSKAMSFFPSLIVQTTRLIMQIQKHNLSCW